jgi:uncharacterized membrane protein YesL
MHRLLQLHTAVAERALRLFLLHLLWILHTVRGGVVVGIFPATAAVHAVLRRDAMEGDHTRSGLRQEFRQAWRAELRRANALGWTLTLAWAVLVVQHGLLVSSGPTGLAAGVAGALWLAMAVLAVVTATSWTVLVHFDESTPAVLRHAATLALGRPLVALATTAGVAVVLCVYYVLPGLAPVLGAALPALVAVTVLWGSGVLPRPTPVTASKETTAA